MYNSSVGISLMVGFRPERQEQEMKDPFDNQPLVISYLDLRKAIGFLGVALPIMVSLGSLFIFGTTLQGSLSGYYYTGTRDWFVGSLWAIGFFLLSYRGYEQKDRITGRLAFAFAIGISLFPTTPDITPPGTYDIIGILHLVFAGLFFGTLIYFALALFVKTNKTKEQLEGTRKAKRNLIYRICGYTMIVCMALIIIYFLLPYETRLALRFLHPIFWLESISIWAFGFSWLTKGETILKDESESVGPFAAPDAIQA